MDREAIQTSPAGIAHQPEHQPALQHSGAYLWVVGSAMHKLHSPPLCQRTQLPLKLHAVVGVQHQGEISVHPDLIHLWAGRAAREKEVTAAGEGEGAEAMPSTLVPGSTALWWGSSSRAL